ncbi:MAG: sigma factor-like helix-turn-helix DNA-binding protein, partial [Streptosporangiaceae bacterium]
ALRLRYGLDETDGREHSLTEIAAHLGISDTAVSSLLKHALISCRRLAEKWGASEEQPPPRQSAATRRNAQPANRLAQVTRLREAEQTLREQGERLTGNRLAEVAHVDPHFAREYARTHRDPTYEAHLDERAYQRLAEACRHLQAQGQKVTVPALVRLTRLGSKVVGAFLNARAGNAPERLTTAYARLQAQGWSKIGCRRLSQAAQVSEHRAKLFLREQGAAQVAHPAQPVTEPPALLKGVDSMDAPTTRAAPPPHFLTYDLDGVLYGDQQLVLNREERILTLIGDGYGEFAAQTCWPAPVFALLQALVDAHPAPCPQATLYAVWAGIEVEEAWEMLAALVQASLLDPALRGLHALLADCQARLAVFNLGIQPVPDEDSYRLFRLSLR